MRTKDGLLTLPLHCDEIACYGEGLERCYQLYDTVSRWDLFIDAHGKEMTYLSVSLLLGWPYTEIRTRIEKARFPYDRARIEAKRSEQEPPMSTDKPKDQLTVLATVTKATVDKPGVRLDTLGDVSSFAGVAPGLYGRADARAVDQLVSRDGSATVAINVPLNPPTAKQYTSENVTPEDLERIRQEWALPDIEAARAFIKQRDLERERREALKIADSKDTDANTAFRHRLKAIQLRQEQDLLVYGEILAESEALANWFKDVDPAELLKGMTTIAAVKHLAQELREDSSYAWSWHCNIAMSMRDSGCDALVAQKGAAMFLQIFTRDENGKGLDITASDEYKGWMEQYHAGQNKPA